jgi:hypothetical protein
MANKLRVAIRLAMKEVGYKNILLSKINELFLYLNKLSIFFFFFFFSFLIFDLLFFFLQVISKEELDTLTQNAYFIQSPELER